MFLMYQGSSCLKFSLLCSKKFRLLVLGRTILLYSIELIMPGLWYKKYSRFCIQKKTDNQGKSWNHKKGNLWRKGPCAWWPDRKMGYRQTRYSTSRHNINTKKEPEYNRCLTWWEFLEAYWSIIGARWMESSAWSRVAKCCTFKWAFSNRQAQTARANIMPPSIHMDTPLCMFCAGAKYASTIQCGHSSTGLSPACTRRGAEPPGNTFIKLTQQSTTPQSCLVLVYTFSKMKKGWNWSLLRTHQHHISSSNFLRTRLVKDCRTAMNGCCAISY